MCCMTYGIRILEIIWRRQAHHHATDGRRRLAMCDGESESAGTDEGVTCPCYYYCDPTVFVGMCQHSSFFRHSLSCWYQYCYCCCCCWAHYCCRQPRWQRRYWNLHPRWWAMYVLLYSGMSPWRYYLVVVGAMVLVERMEMHWEYIGYNGMNDVWTQVDVVRWETWRQKSE